jgi:hypothetical protein
MKKGMCLLLAVLTAVALCSCGVYNTRSVETEGQDGRLTVIYRDDYGTFIFRDNETGVQYFSRAHHGACVMLDGDGKPYTGEPTKTDAEEESLCSMETAPVIHEAETATDTDTNCVPASVLTTDCDTETYTDCVTQPPFDEEYVLRVLTAEAGCDPVLCGCVAQCLYNACERYDWVYSPAEMLVKYQYTGPCDWVSAEAERAFDEVFCSGVTWDCVGKATVFYAPRYGGSAYHESQRFVVEIGGVRFFEEVGS